MSTVSQTAALGKPFFTGDSTFRARDNESDNFVAGVYSHKNIEFSATEAGEWVSYFIFLQSMLQNGIHHFKVRNETGGTLTKGTLVYVSGYSSANTAFLIAKADCDDPTKLPMLVIDSDLATATTGHAFGVITVTGLNTNAYTEGDRVYADGASGGGAGTYVISTAPARSTAQQYWVGTVTVKDATVGEIRFFPAAKNLLKAGQDFIQAEGAIAKWVKYTVSESDFTAAAASESITLFSLPAKGVIEGIYVKHNTAFSGGAVADYTVEIGISGDTAKYVPAFDVFQAVADTAAARSGPHQVLELEAHTGATNILITARCATDDVADATAGSVDVWVKYAVLP